MKLYADTPVRRTRQIIADIAIIAWVIFWVRAGQRVYGTTMEMAEPGHQLKQAGTDFSTTMNNAGDQVTGLPLLEDRIAVPFRSAAGAGTKLQDAGQDLVTGVTNLATLLGWGTALIPIIIVGGIWAFTRIAFIRRASAARAFAVGGYPDLDFFALRALARQPLTRLAGVGPDPAGAWRRGDPAAIRALAALELQASGLRLPPEPVTPRGVGPGTSPDPRRPR
ncbi:hypothetical protein [Janibacter sp. GXQ6167]|uniref:hypothetical protein n=1 Tax=Janibacter sp. GXQ6167 TaxID=3240791 RepID=UPI0035258417